MALKQSLTITGMGFVSGLDVVYKTGENTITTSPLYIKITSVSGDKDTVIAEITYTEENASELVMKKKACFVPDMSGENFIKQAYLHLKTLPEFADAEDC